MLVQKKDIINLIPQKPPMVMVDTLLECSNNKAVTNLTIEPQNILVRNEYLTESGLMENIAQTAALMSGWLSRKKNGNGEIPIGVIGGIKNFRLYSLPQINTKITTEINVIHEVFNASIIKAEVRVGSKILAECEMKIFSLDE